jgi:hypothetical protein
MLELLVAALQVATPPQATIGDFCPSSLPWTAFTECVERLPKTPSAATGSWKDAVKPGSWTAFAETDQIAVLNRPGPKSTTPYQLRWFRFEYPPSKLFQQGYVSSVSLVEANCVKGQIHSRQTTFYNTSNLEGTATQGPPTDWSFPIPDTVGFFQFQSMCEAGR